MTRYKWEKQLTELLPHLLRYAKALTRSNDLAEDLVQDCMERAWSKRMMWNPTRKLRPWMFTIMHNIYINQTCKRSNQVTMVDFDSVLEVSSGDSTDLVQLRDFEQALGKLSPEYREIILLAGLENLSYKEISKIIYVPLGTVMSRLSRAREKLRQLMDGAENEKVVRLR